MTAITDFRHPTERAALELARRWCAGREIGDQPALGHALDVAGTLRRYVPDAVPELIAAVLVHDAPDFAPREVDLDMVLSSRLSPEVARIVAALADEHATMATDRLPDLIEDQPVLLASAADKIVSMTTTLDRSEPPPPGVLNAVGYLDAFATAAASQLPSTMAAELAHLVERAQKLRRGRRPGHGR